MNLNATEVVLTKLLTAVFERKKRRPKPVVARC